MTVRESDARGRGDHGWLVSRHTFSFADYYDPAHMGFRTLRVINEDRVAPGAGFPNHSHRDMEIISYVLEGELEHADSMGNGSIIRPGDVQRMSAGSGVTHSECNPSSTVTVHFLQIWITPAVLNIAPSYEQRSFPEQEKRGVLRLIASGDAREGSVKLHQDANVYAAVLGAADTIDFRCSPGRHTWIQVAKGRLAANGRSLSAGDGLSTSDEGTILLNDARDAEVLVFDLA